MTDVESKMYSMDAAYKPFPTFAEWASRTSVDTGRWNRYSAAIQSRSGSSAEALRKAREVVKRAAAIDTGAIEGLYDVDRGFTFTVAMETAAWEVKLAEKGEHVRPLFEAQMRAYDYVLDQATQSEPISEAAIRELHKVVCGAQETYRVITGLGFREQALPKGRYKVSPNHVMHTRDGETHSYAPVDVTPVEMARLMSEIRSDAFQQAHPVMQAAYAHYAFVVIHPFADGNGRVARALASIFTYRSISMPIMILSEHKNDYLDALEAADGGEYQGFVDFMLSRALDTMTLVEESLQGTQAPSIDEESDAIEKLYRTKGGYTQEQVDQAGEQLFDTIQEEFQKVIISSTKQSIHGDASSINGPRSLPDSSHRLQLTTPKSLHIQFNSNAPASASVFREIAFWLPKDASGSDDVQLVISYGTHIVSIDDEREIAFAARMDDLIPSISGVLQIRISLFVDRFVGEMLKELRVLAERALRGQR
jgi:Fic family protein